MKNKGSHPVNAYPPRRAGDVLSNCGVSWQRLARRCKPGELAKNRRGGATRRRGLPSAKPRNDSRQPSVSRSERGVPSTPPGLRGPAASCERRSGYTGGSRRNPGAPTRPGSPPSGRPSANASGGSGNGPMRWSRPVEHSDDSALPSPGIPASRRGLGASLLFQNSVDSRSPDTLI